MKKVGKYIVLTLLMLLGLCCIGVLYLFFVPGSSLFNITYIYKAKTIEKSEISVKYIDKIELNSRAYEINILPSEDENISYKVYSNTFGFVLNKNKDIKIPEPSIKNNTLIINIVEPHGFALKNNSYINLYVPTTKEINLSLNNIKAKTSIDNENLTINNLHYSTEKGSFTLKNCTINGTLELNLNKGDFKIEENVKTNSNNVILKMTTAEFNAKNSVLGNITIDANKRGVVNVKECKTITNKVSSSGGAIYIEKASHANIATSSTNVNIDNITNGAVISIKKSGNIKISTLSGVSTLSTGSGNIKILKATSAISTVTDSGNITINEAYLTVKAKTNYGTINIDFAKEAESYATNKNARVLHAKLKNGKLTATGVEHIGKYIEPAENEKEADYVTSGIKITGNGRVNLSMNAVYDENDLIGNNGNIKLIIEANSVYSLTTATKNGSVKVNLTQTIEYNGYKTKNERKTNVNCNEESSHKITVKTNSGDLTVLDTNLD